MVRTISRHLLPFAVAAAFFLCAHGSAGAADDQVNVSKQELEELKRKAAEADQLKQQLEQAQKEINALKGTNAVKGPVAFPATGGRPPVWVPPAAVRATANQPPTPALDSLPTVAADTVISANDLVTYFETDPSAAGAHFKGRTFAVRGIATDLHKPLFSALYQVNLRLLEKPLRVTCIFRPPDNFKRVYVSGNGEAMVGETYNSHTTFARVGVELTVRGYCEGLKDGAVILSGCSYLVPAPSPVGNR